MKKLLLAEALLAAGAAFASYQYYYTDTFTTIDTTKWTVNGSLTGTSNGLTGNGSLVSKVTAPDGNDYDVQITVHVANPPQCQSQYTVYARAAMDASSYYALTTASAAGTNLVKKTSSGYTYLASLPVSCTDGMVMRILVKGNQITVWANSPNPFTITDSDLPTGQPGVGIANATVDTISSVKLGPIDHVAPPAITQSSISSVASLHRVDLQWPVGSDDPNGVGLGGYSISRDGVWLGSTAVPLWWDETVSPGNNVTYSLQAYDQHGNYSSPTTYAVAVPTSPGDESRVGVRPDGAYWGAAGEQIDMQSGNLNFSVPLIKALGRGGWSVTFALSYNSQMWRTGNGAIWLSGEDLGEGLGWKLQAGSIRPVWFNQLIHHYVYSDATGAEYRLDQNSNGVWTSLDSTYVAFNANNDYLYFPDGSFWLMNVTSASSEQDAGTMYPSLMEDTNGNQIQVTYAAAAGYYRYSYNTSSRILTISDPRSQYIPTYGAGYNNDWPPHLTQLGNNVGTSENYTFGTAYQQLLEPFTLTTYNNQWPVMLQSATVSGLNIAHQFQYDSSGELTQVTTPLGGILQWAYKTDTFTLTGRSYREVQTRYLKLSSGGTQYQWSVATDTAAAWHGSTTLTDVGANTQKVWTFSTNGSSFPGLATAYEEHASSGAVLLHKDYTWTTDNATQNTGRPYVSSVLTKLNPSTGSEADTKTVQTLDTHGNLTQSQAFNYGNLSTPARTYNYSYLTSSSYASRYIYNRLTSVTMTPAGGSAVTLVTKSYDNAYPAGTQATMHDSAYGTSFLYRGNVAQATGLTSSDTTYFAYDAAGVLVQTTDALGHTVAVSTDSGTNYSLPSAVTPNGNSTLQTSMSYASSFAVTSVTGPNNAQGTTAYDSYGRPSQTQIPDGAITTYTYNYNPTYQVATVNGRWKRTTLDGFGRTTQVDTGHDAVSDANTVSRVVTQYAPCACSPLLKVWRVSQPYNPNSGSPVWTTYTYDGSGRTLTVTAPDGASNTTTSYAGNSTTVTDAAGKWKTSTVDAFGNLTLVTEPNPAGWANWTTSYTYSALNQLTQVTMPRPQGTQTRTFVYTGADMTSATNPENGTVTYVYDATHHVTSRTDAKGQQTQYDYDCYGRVTEVRHYPQQGSEDVHQRVDYTYDQGQNGMGRLTGVSFGRNDFLEVPAPALGYVYVYNQAGRVISQEMLTPVFNPANPQYPTVLNLTAAYQWDNEGRMTSTGYPAATWPGWGVQPAPVYTYQYDNMGRLSGMTEDIFDGNGPQPEVSAGYGPAGEMLSLSYFGVNETRTYNSLLQLTRMTAVPGYGANLMDMQYNYSATQNNGRITSSNDYVTGENVSYTYDVVNRLTGASAGSMWGETYSYDGFGNLTGKNVTQAPAPVLGVSYDANNHQLGLTYDANGNQTWDAQNTTGYGWDVENRLAISASSGWPYAETWYSYDPWGRRVMKDANADPWGLNGGAGYVGGTWEYYFYGVTGQKLATVVCNSNNYPLCAVEGYNVYFGGKLVAKRSNGTWIRSSPVVTDRLGSVRAVQAPWPGSTTSMSYFPWGEERTVTADGAEKFGTYFRDGAGQDYAEQRYYASATGAFFSPDPSGASAADPGNPNRWNMYAYAGGDPINFNDPDGLATSNCGDSWFSYNGSEIGTVSQALNLTANVTILAETEFTEAGHGSGTNSTAEEDMIGEVIMNRWALVNGYWYLYPTPGRPPLDVSAWGSPGGGIDSVTQNGQFAVWNGSSLTTSAQNNLNGALSSAFDSKLCNDLAWAIGSAISFISSSTVNLYYDKTTGLAPLAFNSANLTIPSYMGKIGSFGDANTFYGAPVGDFSANLIPLPRPRPIRPPKPPRKPGPLRGGPRMVQ